MLLFFIKTLILFPKVFKYKISKYLQKTFFLFYDQLLIINKLEHTITNITAKVLCLKFYAVQLNLTFTKVINFIGNSSYVILNLNTLKNHRYGKSNKHNLFQQKLEIFFQFLNKISRMFMLHVLCDTKYPFCK